MAADSRESNMTVIGCGARFKGELMLDGAAQILGTIEGQISSAGQVQIGNGAECNARVEAATIIVDGNVAGDLIARERLQLTGKAVVKGDIAAAALVVAEGATFIGHVAVGPEAVAAAQKKRGPQVEAKPQGKGDWGVAAQPADADWAARAVAAA